MNAKTLDKIKGCLLGVAIGDAMGMPVETLTRKEILAVTGGNGITEFLDPLNRKDWLKDLKAGDTTDDWQLTRAVAMSLIYSFGYFNPKRCAEEHVFELNRSLFGWGKTTQNAIEAIRDGRRVVGIDDLHPSEPGKGCGNGIVMKISPLAICNYLKDGFDAKLWYDTKKLGLLTHPDMRATVSAYAVALSIQGAMGTNRIKDTEGGLRFLPLVIRLVNEVECYQNIGHELSEKLALLYTSLESAESLQNAVGSGFHAHETAAFAIGTFFRHPQDFRAGILEAVNAGGDTDTNASVVGALIGANVGLSQIPAEWKDSHPNFNEPLQVAERLYAVSC